MKAFGIDSYNVRARLFPGFFAHLGDRVPKPPC